MRLLILLLIILFTLFAIPVFACDRYQGGLWYITSEASGSFKGKAVSYSNGFSTGYLELNFPGHWSSSIRVNDVLWIGEKAFIEGRGELTEFGIRKAIIAEIDVIPEVELLVRLYFLNGSRVSLEGYEPYIWTRIENICR